MPWFRELSAEDRSWVGLIVQAGIRGFVDWYRDPGDPTTPPADSALAAAVFGAAPRALAGVINLQQTVDLVRLSIEVVEEQHRRARSTPRRARRCTRPCCATPARSRSPPPRSTPGPPRSAAPGTPGSRPWSSTPCSASDDRRGRALPRQRARLGRPAATWPWCSARRPPQRTETDVFDEVRRVGPGRGHGRAVRHPGRPPGRRARRRRRTPQRRRRGGRRPLRRRVRSCIGPVGRRTWPMPTCSARGRPVRRTGRPPAGRTRRARCAATTCCPSGRWPATATPAGTSSTRSTSRCCSARGTLIETLAAYFDHGALDRGHRPGRCSCTPTRSATGCARSASSPGYTPTVPRARVHPRDRAGPGPAQSGPQRTGQSTIFVGTRQRIAVRVSCAPEARLGGPDTAELMSCSSSSLPVKAPRRPASSSPGSRTRTFGRASRLAVRRWPVSTWPTTAPRPTPTPSATPRSRSRCWSPPAWSPALELLPDPATPFAPVGAVAGHSVGELTARRRLGAITAEQAMVLVRERGKAMAEAAAVTPTGMTAVLGGDRDEVLAAIDKHGLTPANDNGPGQIVAAGTARAARGVRRRAARQGPADPAERRRRLPHRAHGARGRPPRGARRVRVAARPAHPVISNATARWCATAATCSPGSSARSASPVRWDLCMETMLDLGVTGILELPPAGTLTGIARRAHEGRRDLRAQDPRPARRRPRVRATSTASRPLQPPPRRTPTDGHDLQPAGRSARRHPRDRRLPPQPGHPQRRHHRGHRLQRRVDPAALGHQAAPLGRRPTRPCR